MLYSKTDYRVLRTGMWATALAAAAFMTADILSSPPAAWLMLMPVYCLSAFALLHSLSFFGPRRALWFALLALVLAFVAEYLGTNFGAIFGSHWFARARDMRIPVDATLPGRVPLVVVLGWFSQLYLAFVTAVFLTRSHPRDATSFAATPLAAGMLMALWQLTAGPVAVHRGTMGFVAEGFYHGVPLSSFVGWFATSMFIVLFFIATTPRAADATRFLDSGHCLAPLALTGFGVTMLYATLLAFRFHLNGPAWLGVAALCVYVIALTVRANRLTEGLETSLDPT